MCKRLCPLTSAFGVEARDGAGACFCDPLSCTTILRMPVKRKTIIALSIRREFIIKRNINNQEQGFKKNRLKNVRF